MGVLRYNMSGRQEEFPGLSGRVRAVSYDESGSIIGIVPERSNLITRIAHKGFSRLLVGGYSLDFILGTSQTAPSIDDVWLAGHLETHFAATPQLTNVEFVEYFLSCNTTHNASIYELGTKCENILISRVVLSSALQIVNGGKTVIVWTYGIGGLI